MYKFPLFVFLIYFFKLLNWIFWCIVRWYVSGRYFKIWPPSHLADIQLSEACNEPDARHPRAPRLHNLTSCVSPPPSSRNQSTGDLARHQFLFFFCFFCRPWKMCMCNIYLTKPLHLKLTVAKAKSNKKKCRRWWCGLDYTHKGHKVYISYVWLVVFNARSTRKRGEFRSCSADEQRKDVQRCFFLLMGL